MAEPAEKPDARAVDHVGREVHIKIDVVRIVLD